MNPIVLSWTPALIGAGCYVLWRAIRYLHAHRRPLVPQHDGQTPAVSLAPDRRREVLPEEVRPGDVLADGRLLVVYPSGRTDAISSGSVWVDPFQADAAAYYGWRVEQTAQEGQNVMYRVVR